MGFNLPISFTGGHNRVAQTYIIWGGYGAAEPTSSPRTT